MRYRWIAAASKLVGDRKSPRSIAAEFDLYTLPEGGKANGYTGDDLELELSRQVDQRIPGICVGASQAVGGHVSDQALERDIVWLMKTFVARSPMTLARQEAAVVDTMAKHRGTIERMLERVQSDELRAEILGFQDPRMPKVAARAGLAVAMSADILRKEGWLEGDVHLVRDVDVKPYLRGIGTEEFVTFEDPVVEWKDDSGFGLIASFSLSPSVLVLIVERGAEVRVENYESVSLHHTLAPLSTRSNLICQTEPTGHLYEWAKKLRPSVANR